MKTNLPSSLAALITLALIASAVRAQDESYSEDNTAYESSDATSVVYDQPVAYYASVVYQSAVTYNAPVYYIAAGAAATVAYEAQCQQQQQAEQPVPASTVIVLGGGGGTYTYSKYDSECQPASQVIQFGQRGGWFGSRR